MSIKTLALAVLVLFPIAAFSSQDALKTDKETGVVYFRREEKLFKYTKALVRARQLMEQANADDVRTASDKRVNKGIRKLVKASDRLQADLVAIQDGLETVDQKIGFARSVEQIRVKHPHLVSEDQVEALFARLELVRKALLTESRSGMNEAQIHQRVMDMAKIVSALDTHANAGSSSARSNSVN